MTGAGEGARSEQAAIANQNAIKMKDFENSLRIAALHNQDLELQLRTQQQDAHEAMQRQHADWDEAHGRITWNPHPNDAEAVTQTLKAQTAANGSAEIPAGTFLVHDGSTINSPGNDAGHTSWLAREVQATRRRNPWYSGLPPHG